MTGLWILNGVLMTMDRRNRLFSIGNNLCRSARRAFLAGGVLALALTSVVAFAPQADALKLTMRRVIFEGNVRSDTLTIINDSAEEVTYRLEWRRMRMDQNNNLVVVEGDEPVAGLMEAHEFVIFAPRRAVLPPGGSQQVRLMLRKPRDLAEGEYRSHLWIRPEADVVKFNPDVDAAAEGPAVQLRMLAGVTVPVFIRHGQTQVQAKIDEATLSSDGDAATLKMRISREGNRSLYGDIDLVCADGRVLQQIRGIAVYTEISSRNLSFPLALGASDIQGCGGMTALYRADPSDAVFRGGVLAEAAVAVRN